ncbi:MAG: glutamine amidotransferase [Oxalicibacterium faecigallinarum]|uniref:glutamine amidotransferase n=1 Tax=Oxalicibacterium faecigallinarum TaxID=573741 RepID=UPI002808DC07|nr:glutamine amidotransferase [Oxalicibacterium faecigallinarum]MDQ7969573.1 glutamine amidotransferase [Oxalicibacterium faecigallinarum]
MKTVLAVRHVHFEDLGIFEPWLRARGYEICYIDPTIDNLDHLDVVAPDLMVVLGGPIGAFDDAIHPFVTQEMAMVKARLASGRAMLGICLGAQFMARALGARVYPMGVKEIGFSPLTLTAQGQQSPLALLNDVPVLHWHGDQFDIPAGADHLALTSVGKHQAFSVGSTVLGLQCHLEADTARIEQWLVGHASELSQAGIDPNALRAEAQRIGPQLQEVALKVFETWLQRALA